MVLINTFFAKIPDLLSYFSNWNIILVIILLCSIIGFAVFIERLIHLHKAEVDTNELITNLRQTIQEGNIIEAITYCEQNPSTIANVIKAGLLKHNKGKEEIETAMEISGLIEISKLEKNSKALSIIAHISPLIGLLGTVLGFIKAFGEMRQAGLMDISATRIGEAMEYALITTAAGLVVAIPAVIAYNYIVSRIQRFTLEMQTVTPEIVDLLIYPREKYEL